MNDPSSTVNRVVIIGTSGCGKTVFGSKIANALSVKFIDLDDLNWLPGWEQRPEEDFFHDIKRETSCEKWIVSGNYSRASKFLWPQADMIIWLDFPLYLCLWRALKRSLSRILSRKMCCNGNYETLNRLFGTDSILLWIWNTHSRRKKAYQTHFSGVGGSVCFLRFNNDEEANEFVNQVLKNKFIKFKPTTSQGAPL